MSRPLDHVVLIVYMLLLVGTNRIGAWRSDDAGAVAQLHVIQRKPLDASVRQRLLLTAEHKAKVTTVATKSDESLFAICTAASDTSSGPRAKVLAWFQWVDAAGAIKYVVAEVQGQLLKGVESAADITSIELSYGGKSLALDKVSKLDNTSSVAFPVLGQGVIDDAAVKTAFAADKLTTAADLWGKISKGHFTVGVEAAGLSLQGYLDLPISMGTAISLVKYQIYSLTAGASDRASDHSSRRDIPWFARRDGGVSTDMSKVCYRASTQAPFSCQEYTGGNCSVDIAHTFDNVDLCCASYRLQVDPYQVTCNMYMAPDSCYYIDLTGDPTCKKSTDAQNCTGSKYVYTSLDSCELVAALLPKPKAAPDMAWDRAYEADRYSMRGNWDQEQDLPRDRQDRRYEEGYAQGSDAENHRRTYDHDWHRTRDGGYRRNTYDRQADYMAQGDSRDRYTNDYERSSSGRDSWGRNGYDSQRQQDSRWGRKLAGGSVQQTVTRMLRQTGSTAQPLPAFSKGDMSMWAICEPVAGAEGSAARPKVFAWLHWSDDAAAIKYVVIEVMGAPLTGVKKKADISSVTLTIPEGGSLALTKSEHEFNRSMDSYTVLAKGTIQDAEAAKAGFRTCWDMWRKILLGTSTVTVGTTAHPKKAVMGQVDLPYALGASYLHVTLALGSIDVTAATPDRGGWDLGTRNPGEQDHGRYHNDRYRNQWDEQDPNQNYDSYNGNEANDATYQSDSYRWERERRERDSARDAYYSGSNSHDNNRNGWAADADGMREGSNRFGDEDQHADGLWRYDNRDTYRQAGPGQDYSREDAQARWERERYEANQQTNQDWEPYRG